MSLPAATPTRFRPQLPARRRDLRATTTGSIGTSTGREDEVRQWKRQSESRYRYTIEPVDLVEQDGQTILTATLTGDFPGSPVDLIYEFTIAEGVIEALSIHP